MMNEKTNVEQRMMIEEKDDEAKVLVFDLAGYFRESGLNLCKFWVILPACKSQSRIKGTAIIIGSLIGRY
jgi:hypothetical protein